MIVVMIALAGGAGAVLRYVVDVVLTGGMRIPGEWATVIINLVGGFVLGIGMGLDAGSGSQAALVLAMGLCGGFTTFSTATLDALRLLTEGRLGRSAVIIASHIGMSMAGVAAGLLVAGLGSGQLS